MKFSKFFNKNIVCFEKNELKQIFEDAKKQEFKEELRKRKISFSCLRNNMQVMEDMAGEMGEKTAQDRDEHEIFGVAYDFIDFYDGNSQICFELKNNVDIKKGITNLADLKNAREENSLNDFIIRSKDVFRPFQLKRYRDRANTKSLLEFIKLKLREYGNNLGYTNLLIVLQTKEYDISGIDFEIIHKELHAMELKQTAGILISYNENNKFSIINSIFPELSRSEIPLDINLRDNGIKSSLTPSD